MAIAAKLALADRLPMEVVRFTPVEVLSLIRSLVAATMLESLFLVGEILGISGGLVDKILVADDVGPAVTAGI
ncbi:MAG: hypothetical protein Q9171_002024 [Xanthocarpia ochracea]